MNGAKIMQTQVLGNVGTNWFVIGQRDFTGSGNTDVLWRDTSGNVGIWVMNGTSLVSSTILGNVRPPGRWLSTGNSTLVAQVPFCGGTISAICPFGS